MFKILKEIPLLRGFVRKQENVIYLDSPVESGKKLYAERKYRTWNDTECSLIIDKIKTAIKKKRRVNLSELKDLMQYRSISSIRCKVLWYLNRFGYYVGTYTENN